MGRRCGGAALAVLLLVAVVGAACGGGNTRAASSDAPPTTVVTEPTVAPASATPAPTATSVAGPLPTPAAQDPDSGSDEVFLLGERIFMTEAGDGVGCSFCHGPTGLGLIGPNIRGKQPADIKLALDSLPPMEFLRLSQKKIEAVSVYLQWLATQPE